MTQANLVLIGAGRMGSALAKGWLAAGRPADSFFAVDPVRGPHAAALIEAGVRVEPALTAEDAAGVETVLLAVKPQMLNKAAAEFAPLIPDGAMVLSILAGRTLSSLRDLFGDRPLVRAMPNTPAAVGKGYSVFVTSDGTPAERAQEAHELLSAGGDVAQVDDEGLMDAVTAVSGSGPAYFFLMAEALAGAGRQEGLPEDLAKDLARATLIGAGALLDVSEEGPGKLREGVTSPGGTTAAALDVLNHEPGLPALMRRTVAAAARRSRELRE